MLDYLKAHPACTGKLGVVSICISGHLALRAAMNPDVLAAACFYATNIHKRGLGKGTNDNTLDRVPEIQGELLMIWGRQDPHVPREGRALVYNTLVDAGIHFTWHEFNVQHAFLRYESYRYDSAATFRCYGLVSELLHCRLGEGDLPARVEGGPGETRY